MKYKKIVINEIDDLLYLIDNINKENITERQYYRIVEETIFKIKATLVDTVPSFLSQNFSDEKAIKDLNEVLHRIYCTIDSMCAHASEDIERSCGILTALEEDVEDLFKVCEEYHIQILDKNMDIVNHWLF